MYTYVMEHKVRSFILLQLVLFIIHGGMGDVRYYVGSTTHGRDYTPTMDMLYQVVTMVVCYMVLRTLVVRLYRWVRRA